MNPLGAIRIKLIFIYFQCIHLFLVFHKSDLKSLKLNEYVLCIEILG